MYNGKKKRQAPFNHYGNEHSQKQRPALPRSNFPPQNRGNPHDYDRNSNTPKKVRNKDNPVVDYLARLPDPTKCSSCELTADEMQTGMIALLDKLEAEETSPEGDMDVLHHARELRRLLSTRDSKKRSSESKKALDEKRPEKEKYVRIPAYIADKMTQAKDLPTLPHISEPYLQEAVFTHDTAYGQRSLKGMHDPDRISYDRLEFLGDAYIELISSRLIYSRWPHLDVPELSTLREQLVKNETLSKFSYAYGFPDRLKHGGHVADTKGWGKITADVFEAYVAGLILSDSVNGFQTAEKWLTELWAPQLIDYKEPVIDNPLAKDELARLAACRGVVLNYRADKELRNGEDGVQIVSMAVYLTGWGYKDELLGSGEARNKAQAGVAAAADAIRRNNAVLQFATKKKQEFIAERLEDQRKAEESAAVIGDIAASDNGGNQPSLKQTERSTSSLVEKEETAQEEKKRKKKEKKERREKAKNHDE